MIPYDELTITRHLHHDSLVLSVSYFTASSYLYLQRLPPFFSSFLASYRPANIPKSASDATVRRYSEFVVALSLRLVQSEAACNQPPGTDVAS